MASDVDFLIRKTLLSKKSFCPKSVSCTPALEAQHSGGTVSSIAFIQKACATFHLYASNFDVGSSSDEDDAPAADADSDDEQPPGNAEDNAKNINRNSLCLFCLLSNRNSVSNPCGHTAC